MDRQVISIRKPPNPNFCAPQRDFRKMPSPPSQPLHHASGSATWSVQAPAATQRTRIDRGGHSPPRTQAWRHNSPNCPSTSITFCAHASSACYTQAEHAARRPGRLPPEANGELDSSAAPIPKAAQGESHPVRLFRAKHGPRGPAVGCSPPLHLHLTIVTDL